MIYRLHYRYLNNYLAFYFQELERKSLHKAKTIQKSVKHIENIARSKAKLISAIA